MFPSHHPLVLQSLTGKSNTTFLPSIAGKHHRLHPPLLWREQVRFWFLAQIDLNTTTLSVGGRALQIFQDQIAGFVREIWSWHAINLTVASWLWTLKTLPEDCTYIWANNDTSCLILLSRMTLFYPIKFLSMFELIPDVNYVKIWPSNSLGVQKIQDKLKHKHSFADCDEPRNRNLFNSQESGSNPYRSEGSTRSKFPRLLPIKLILPPSN